MWRRFIIAFASLGLIAGISVAIPTAAQATTYYYAYNEGNVNGFWLIYSSTYSFFEVTDSPGSHTTRYDYISEGSYWYEIEQADTSECLTYNATTDLEDEVTCNDLASQLWYLYDNNDGGYNYDNEYTLDNGYEDCLYDDGNGDATSLATCDSTNDAQGWITATTD